MTAPRDRCAHCGRPLEGHGVRYSAIPGNHTFTREPGSYAGPPTTIPATPR